MLHITRKALPRPLASHPPVMVPQLCRAITRSPRWHAMQKHATQAAQAAIDEERGKIEERIKASKTRKERKSHERQLQQLMQESSSPSNALAILPPTSLPKFNVLDCTLGGGTHTEAILEAGEPFTRVAALDCDAGGVQRRAEIIAKKYGKSRFRYFPHFRFSQVQTVFAPRSFDAVVIDPGPNFSQIDDPTRGFSLDDPEDTSLFDMRYSPRFKTSALELVNRAEEPELWTCAAELALLPNSLARQMVQALIRNRPFRGIGEVLGALQMYPSAGEVTPDSWQRELTDKYSFGHVSPVMRFLFALRAFVNNEPQELAEGLRAATECLDYDGRLIVFTRLPFEREIVKEFATNFPYALTCFEERITREEADEFSQPLHTRMHVLQRTEKPCFDIKNIPLLEDEGKRKQVRAEDHQRWLYSLDVLGGKYSFPSRSFGGMNPKPSRKERRIAEENESPKPIVADRMTREKLPKY